MSCAAHALSGFAIMLGSRDITASHQAHRSRAFGGDLSATTRLRFLKRIVYQATSMPLRGLKVSRHISTTRGSVRCSLRLLRHSTAKFGEAVLPGLRASFVHGESVSRVCGCARIPSVRCRAIGRTASPSATHAIFQAGRRRRIWTKLVLRRSRAGEVPCAEVAVDIARRDANDPE